MSALAVLKLFYQINLSEMSHIVSFYPGETTSVSSVMTDVTGNVAPYQENCFDICLVGTYKRFQCYSEAGVSERDCDVMVYEAPSFIYVEL